MFLTRGTPLQQFRSPTPRPTRRPTRRPSALVPTTPTMSPTLSPTLNPTFSPTEGATPTVSKETSAEPTMLHGRPTGGSTRAEVGSNDFQYGVYKKEIVSSCDEVIGTDCTKTCFDTTYIYNGDILISETKGDEYSAPCDP